MEKLFITHARAPGDVTVLTALVRDIATTYPGRFELGVGTTFPSIWQNNPYITDFGLRHDSTILPGMKHVRADYGAGLHEQHHETIHFLNYFHRDFARKTGLQVPLTRPWPDLHLSDQERNEPYVRGRYWLFLSGGKTDFTIKVWDYRHWDTVVTQLYELGVPCVQTGLLEDGHWHPPIGKAVNLLGFGALRELINLIYHADGVICGVTCAMHMAAALQKPCVVLAGGREPWWWEAYVPENTGLGGPAVANQIKVPHRFLHTIGQLDCCQASGCLRNKVLRTADDASACYKPVLRPGQAVAGCMARITPRHVVDAVCSYYLDGTLSPIPGSRLAELLPV